MIGYKEIKKAVNNLINKNFKAKINSNNIKEGFMRPSFFIELDDVKQTAYEEQIHRSMTIRIFYFPSDRETYSIEVLEVQQKLEEVFDLKLRVLDREININETEAAVSDGVLEFSFEIDFYDAREISYADKNRYVGINDENGDPIFIELMEKLHIKE